VMDMQYVYSATQNNGRIVQSIDGVLSETVNYTYDSLNRLSTALATNGAMTQQYSYDGFGNLTGTLGAIVWSFDPSRNAPAGSVDANGDSATAGLQWNVENRLVGQSQYPSTRTIGYDPWGKRVWEQTWDANNGPGNPLVTVYSITGQRLRQFTLVKDGQGHVTLTAGGENVYFGGKLIRSQGVTVATDRLGSVRANANGEKMAYLPYGQERGTPTTPDNREKFGTYWRDQTLGADYADQRYYSSTTGSFFSPDPMGLASVNPAIPSSWNRYAYASGDPVNRVDPRGMDDCGADWMTNAEESGPCGNPCNGPGMGAGFMPMPDPSCYAPIGRIPKHGPSNPGQPFLDTISIGNTGNFQLTQTFNVTYQGQLYSGVQILSKQGAVSNSNIIVATRSSVTINGSAGPGGSCQ